VGFCKEVPRTRAPRVAGETRTALRVEIFAPDADPTLPARVPLAGIPSLSEDRPVLDSNTARGPPLEGRWARVARPFQDIFSL